MAGFFYFVEGRTAEQIPREEVEAWGLSYLLETEKGKPAGRYSLEGPGGKGGVVFGMSDRQENRTIGFFPEKQEWRPMEMAGGEGDGSAKIYVGWWKKFPPRPADLERRDLIKHAGATLSDGSKWKVPQLREFREEDRATFEILLPRLMKRTRKGWQDGGLLPKYLPLWERHLATLDAMWNSVAGADAEGNARIDTLHVYDHAIELLQMAYVVGGDELLAMGLTTAEDLITVIKAASDWERHMAYLLKKNSDPPPDEKPGDAA